MDPMMTNAPAIVAAPERGTYVARWVVSGEVIATAPDRAALDAALASIGIDPACVAP